MLRAGPIPGFLHGVIEYAAGVLLIVAPFLLGFDDGAATAASIVMGVVVIAIAASTAGATGLVDQIAVSVHVALDYFVVVLLIAIPFIFGFSEEGAPTAFFIALGVAHLLVTIGTRFVRPEADAGGGAGRGLRRHRSR